MSKEEKTAIKHLQKLLSIENINPIDTIEINSKIAEYIHIVWKSRVIQHCFLQQNIKFSGFFGLFF